jgi:hypothetical protein
MKSSELRESESLDVWFWCLRELEVGWWWLRSSDSPDEPCLDRVVLEL